MRSSSSSYYSSSSRFASCRSYVLLVFPSALASFRSSCRSCSETRLSRARCALCARPRAGPGSSVARSVCAGTRVARLFGLLRTPCTFFPIHQQSERARRRKGKHDFREAARTAAALTPGHEEYDSRWSSPAAHVTDCSELSHA